MKIEELEKILLENKNEEVALIQQKYMKNTCLFLGLSQKELGVLSKDFIACHKKDSIDEIMKLVHELSNKKYRDFYYIAISLLKTNIKNLRYKDILELTKIATTISPWWNTTDSANLVVRRWFLLKENRKYLEKYILKNINSKNKWVIRMGIICQLCMKEEVNLDLVNIIIEKTYQSSEFFIQKALGWLLRDISYTFPLYIRKVVDGYNLKPVTLREAKKYI
ncbi:MAG: DNA alkylation repair protein [Bacilli bacterium]